MNNAVALLPGLRDRLFQEMDGARIPEEGRLAYLCSMTGRRPQTARRWIDGERPGLPDLESFAVICGAFDTDANWMLGLTKARYPLPRAAADEERGAVAAGRNATWQLGDYITREIGKHAAGCDLFYMPGDDMEPRIKSGAPILVDRSATDITGNGTYLLEYQRRTMVRHVDMRIGEGLVLSCENPKYKPSVVKDATTARRLGLKVIGRVRLGVAFEPL